ncbi:MAG: class I tRNA ligase family protein, partial [Planctomycetota bacterium]|jgi:isoleucyl-tRNA synthetase
VFNKIYNFCTIEMSSIYMDVLKDRMYCDATDSVSRRSGQTAMYNILDALVRMLAPILAHTAEEAWAAMPTLDSSIDPSDNEDKWDKVMALRDEVLKALENLRTGQTIRSNQEASVQIETDDGELVAIVNDMGIETFASICIVSEVKIATGDSLKVSAEKCSHAKCERCWNYYPSVGQHAEYPDLCGRCRKVVAGL